MADAKTVDPEAMLLYQYLWKPACYAVPQWLHRLGFQPTQSWRYGEHPVLDRSLDRALRALRGTPALPPRMTDRQRRFVQRAPRLKTFALALGLMKLGRSDYLLLPDYRQLILQFLSEEEVWRLYGWLGQRKGGLLTPETMITMAIQIGVLILHREARNDPILHTLLILLPPPERQLWPGITRAKIQFLEQLLWV